MNLKPAALGRQCVLSTAILAANAFVGSAYGQATPADTTANTRASTLEEVMVVAQRARRVSSGATNLDMEIKETPQSISLITQEQMEQFGVDDLNEALRLATGIQVEQVSTNLTQFLARGFEIKNTQIDGVGLPNGWGLVTNAMDAFGFEKLEVIRGANGLLTGVGNASGTINYVRKRPTNEAQGHVGVTVGSWDRRRVEADYSTPFNDAGTWAGRVVVATEESDSYLRDFETDRKYVYGVIDGQIGEHGTLAVGYSWQQADTTGNMWGALTFVSNTGQQLEWDRSASTTQDWTYWNSNTQAGFVEYTHQLAERWQLKASYNYRVYDHDSKLFLGYSVSGIDPATGEGLLGWAYKSPYETKAHLGDVKLNGRFELFGREHEAMLGVSLARSEGMDYYQPTDFDNPAFGFLPSFPYAGDVIPEPVWEGRVVYTKLDQRMKRVFGATRLAMTDRLKAIVGFNWAEYQRTGYNTDTGTSFDQTTRDVSPYAGLTFAFTDKVLGYVNYSYIFQPQEQIDYDSNYLDPSKGVNYEAGVKAEWLDRRVLTTLAWFNAKQEGLATYVGTRFMDGYAYGYYNAVDVESKGIEFEVTGKLNEYTDLLLGYTYLKMDGNEGDDTYAWVPRRTANVMLSARVPSYTALSFGVGGKWQSKVFNADSYTDYLVRQGSYTLLNAFAAWDVQPNVTVRANVGNLTNEKVILSVYDMSYYNAPRNYTVSLDWRF
ncbi:TonB-dependent siderophore receptor [Steroidobacter sp.]|uniref:TonB-dependent siderophore receptor n=1 Tax=Steroidobacter sp. TaxID=1978227 RepID=UPI001A59FA25|nr:TonB-dependent siderophore receptor [Steroidobacter sp.]MBL8272012.1 TonB-dependent siderophore receptor [Steroidobacter sp.]